MNSFQQCLGRPCPRQLVAIMGQSPSHNTASCAALTAFAWASPHFHRSAAYVKMWHTPGTLYETAKWTLNRASVHGWRNK